MKFKFDINLKKKSQPAGARVPCDLGNYALTNPYRQVLALTDCVYSMDSFNRERVANSVRSSRSKPNKLRQRRDWSGLFALFGDYFGWRKLLEVTFKPQFIKTTMRFLKSISTGLVTMDSTNHSVILTQFSKISIKS